MKVSQSLFVQLKTSDFSEAFWSFYVHHFLHFTDTLLHLVLLTILSNGNFLTETSSRIFQDTTPSSTRWLSIQMVYWCQEVKYNPHFVLQSDYFIKIYKNILLLYLPSSHYRYLPTHYLAFCHF